MISTTQKTAWEKSLSNLPDYDATYPKGTHVPLSTRLGPVRLAVTSADRALAVWQDLVGLEVLEQNPQEIILGIGPKPLIELELSATEPAISGATGLYHVAIHVASRRDLAAVIVQLMKAGYHHSPVDHLINEAVYFSDLDGNGIEIDYETPFRGFISYNEEEFNRTGIAGYTTEGSPHSAREHLDLNSLFSELGSDPKQHLSDKLSPGTYVGHLHLTVGDIDLAVHFYKELIGFKYSYTNYRFGIGDVIVDYPPHIIALNTWGKRNVSQTGSNHAGLRNFNLEVPSASDLSAVTERLKAASIPVEHLQNGIAVSDPEGNLVRINVAQ